MHPRRLILIAVLTACGTPSTPTDASSEDAPASDAGTCGSDVTPGPGIVITTSGAVRGAMTGEGADAAWAWRGVPFAEPPLRWRPPEPRACWSGVREADAWPALCPQMAFDGAPGEEPVGTPTGENDCLAVNVWAPATEAAPRAVLVFIHGGGNQQGGSSQLQADTRIYEGDLLAARGDVIVVTLQYRLGPFGYLAHPALADGDTPAGNYGLLDQIAALRWVQANIAAFGGDPSRVTIFGESGGAVDVCALYASPLAAGLFSGAIMESGACLGLPTASVEAIADTHASALGCPAPTDRACLEGITDAQWLSVLEPPLAAGRVSLDWGPSIDGAVLPDSPEAMIARGEHNHVPFVVGSNAEETGASVPRTITPALVRAAFAMFPEHEDELLALYPPGDTDASARAAYVAATTDGQFTCTAARVARFAAASQSEPVFRYFFDHRPDSAAGRLLGAVHGLELFYVFQTFERSAYAARATAADEAVATLMATRWAALARDGSASGEPSWPRYDASEPSFVIAEPPEVRLAVRAEACAVWDAIAGGD